MSLFLTRWDFGVCTNTWNHTEDLKICAVGKRPIFIGGLKSDGIFHNKAVNVWYNTNSDTHGGERIESEDLIHH